VEAKLTSKLDQMVISSAKKHAGNNNRGLSKLEEEYPPLVKKLSGIISEDDLKKLLKYDDRVKNILREKA
jgi:hypothetical protein